jgi:hypothetical protein
MSQVFKGAAATAAMGPWRSHFDAMVINGTRAPLALLTLAWRHHSHPEKPLRPGRQGQVSRDVEKAASDAVVRETDETFRKQPKRDLATYLADLKKPGPLVQHALTYEIVNDTEKEAELKVTECLWAKTFREANAGDVGYAMICHTDIAGITAFNPKITLARPKLLMQGDDECRFRWTMGA